MRTFLSLSLLLLFKAVSGQFFYEENTQQYYRCIQLTSSHDFVIEFGDGNAVNYQYGHYIQKKNRMVFQITAYSNYGLDSNKTQHPKKEIIVLKKRKDKWIEVYQTTVLKQKALRQKRISRKMKRYYSFRTILK